MKINFNIEEAVKKRSSIRTYLDKPVEKDKINEIEKFINTLENPFGNKVNFHFLDSEEIEDKQTLGTYGMIKGANQFIGTTVKQEGFSLEAVGYEFETLQLYLADLGIGTCWLGGTFNRKGFAQAMNLGNEELFPAISPFGYASHKRDIKELSIRRMIKADKRKEWNELFFKDTFDTTLTKEEAGEMEFPLEMVRLGPSASNKQPWRIVVTDGACHFYEYSEPGYSKNFPYDIQRIDMGIAAAHFDYSVKEKKIEGHFKTDADPGIEAPKNIQYAFSWIRD